MTVSGPHSIQHTTVSSVDRSVQLPQPLNPPLQAGASGGPNSVTANVVALSNRKEKMPDILEQLVNNFIATAKMTASALKTVGQEWASNIQEGQLDVLPRFIASTIGAVLYSGSLIAGAAIKAALWLPIIGLTATTSFAAGVVAWIVSIGSEKAADQVRDFTTHLVGWSLSSITALVSGITIVARGPLWLTGGLGALCMIRWSPKDEIQANEQEHKIKAGLYQTLQDALLLWTGGTQNVWDIPHEFFGLRNKEERYRLTQILHEMGANVYSVESGKYSLSPVAKEVLEDIFGKDAANKIKNSE